MHYFEDFAVKKRFIENKKCFPGVEL
jgi:hypothetical protein